MRDLPYDSHPGGVSPSAPTTCGWVQTPPFLSTGRSRKGARARIELQR